MKIGIVIATNDAETAWNAIRLGNFALKKKDTVKIFLLGRGVEVESIGTDQFQTTSQLEEFVEKGGVVYACGTCLKIRKAGATELCPLSTMQDLYEIIAESDKILTF
jgi:uncharacterized protein involved in oxidation of intracellular sulfur